MQADMHGYSFLQGRGRFSGMAVLMIKFQHEQTLDYLKL